MGAIVSTLRDHICTCFGRDEEKRQYVETNYITPKTTQPDIEPDTSDLDYTTDDRHDVRNLKCSTMDRLEHGTRITYYVLNNGNRIDMI